MPSKPRPGGAFLRPTGMEVPRKFGVGKQQVSCPCTLPAAILAVGGWRGLQGVCRAPEDQTKSCRRQRDIFMRIRPFSQLRCIKTGRLLSACRRATRARAVPCGHRRALTRPGHVGQYQRQSAYVLRGHDSAHDWRWKANCPKLAKACASVGAQPRYLGLTCVLVPRIALASAPGNSAKGF